MKNEKLLAIDGSSMLVTAYHGSMPNELRYAKTDEAKEAAYKKLMQTSDGIYTNAVYTMIKTLLKIIEEQQPTHIVIAWDISRKTFRTEEYKDYKANRAPSQSPLLQQFKTAQQVLGAMGFYQLMDVNYEADDFVGTIVKKFEKEIPTYIITKDRDYLQLVSDYTRLWMICENWKELRETYYDKDCKFPAKSIELTPSLVKAIFDVEPHQVADFKGLVGDSADNIKGVPGVGDKAAIPLIEEYGSIEAIYELLEAENGDEKGLKEIAKFWKESLGIKRSPIKSLLEESIKDENGEIIEFRGKDAAMICKKIATIKTDLDINVELEDLRFTMNEAANQEQFKKLEFKSLIKEEPSKIEDGKTA